MKKNMMRVLVSAMAGAMILGTTAFAQNDNDVVVDAIPLAVEETEGTNNTKETQETEQAAYVTYTGTVLEKEEGQDGAWRVTIGNEEGPTLVANLMPGVQVFDAGAPEESKSVEDVGKGMEVTFILPSLSPMTMSLPPQSSSVEAVVLHSADGSFTVGKFDENLVCEEAMLQLNLSEETPISSITGNKKVYSAEDVKNSEALVFYTITTRSIPAQTTPSKVVILAEAEDAAQPQVTAETKSVTEEAVATYVPMRTIAEEAGFTVEWVSNDAPVTWNKDGLVLEFLQGSNVIRVNGEAITLDLDTKLEKDTMMVSSDVANYMK